MAECASIRTERRNWIMKPKLWFGLPGHLDNADNAPEVARFFDDEKLQLQRIMKHISAIEFRASSMKRGALSDPDVCREISLWDLDAVDVVVRVGVLGRSDDNAFENDLDAILQFQNNASVVVTGIIGESVISGLSDDDRIDHELEKGGNVEDRARYVAYAQQRASAALGIAASCYIGNTSLAKDDNTNRQGERLFDYKADTQLVVDVCESNHVEIAGFLEAFNADAAGDDMAEVIAGACTHVRATLGCEFGIIPINSATDPEKYRAGLVAQVAAIRRASRAINWIASSTWNRPLGVPTLDDHAANTLAIIEAADIRPLAE